MPYIGKDPGTGLRGRFIYTATAGQTSFTGADSLGRTLTYTDSEYTDVYLNGVKLDKTDYTATSGTSIVLDSGASAGDILEILAFDTFGLFSGEFAQDVTVAGDLTVSGTTTTAATTMTGDLSLADKIVHTGDTNTAIRFADADTVTIETGGSERLRIDSSGNVGIGTSSPDSSITVSGASKVFSTTANNSITTSVNTSSTYAQTITLNDVGLAFDNNSALRGYTFSNNGSERMRIDSSGNLLVGTTSSDPRNFTGGTYGSLLNAGQPEFAVNAGMFINQSSGSDGKHISFRKEGTTVGDVGTWGGGFFVGSPSVNDTYLYFANSYVAPSTTSAFRDNAVDLGNSSARFDDIYATNTSIISTSDANEKQQIASLTEAEITAAKALSKLFKTFKWNSAVESKGDNARTHTGHIAQEVQSAMTDAGLDANKYAFWCSDTWWETQTEVPAVEADEENDVEAQDAYTRTDVFETAEEAPEGATERTRLGIRYPELLAFIGAATEQRLADIETRLTALEG
jgi:hypothetical protein